MPKIFNWVHIWWLSRCSPPIDPRSCIKILCYTRSMFRVVILHKTMGSRWRKCLLNEWKGSLLKNFAVKWSCHYSFKNANFGWSLFAYSFLLGVLGEVFPPPFDNSVDDVFPAEQWSHHSILHSQNLRGGKPLPIAGVFPCFPDIIIS